MDLLNKYMKGCSPYIVKFTYDLERREVIIVCGNNVGKWKPGKQLKFTDVVGFTENVYDFEDLIDNNLIDSVMGLYKNQNGAYCLSTEKRELIIQTTKEPISSSV